MDIKLLTDVEKASIGERQPLPDRYLGDGCSTLGTVQLSALHSDDSQIALANLGPVTCPVADAFAAWTRFGVDRMVDEYVAVYRRIVEGRRGSRAPGH